jgi:hypothetical protein
MIERIWNHVKSRLRTKYCDKFSVFCHTKDSTLNCDDVKNKNAVDNLIGEKVQLFDDLMPINDSVFVSGNVQKIAV